MIAVTRAEAQQGFNNGGLNTCSVVLNPNLLPTSTCYGYINSIPTFFSWQAPGSALPLVFANGVGSGNTGNLNGGVSIDILGNVLLPKPGGTLTMQGAVSAGGTTGTNGQVLTSTGTGAIWAAGGGGGGVGDTITLTSAVTGTGTINVGGTATIATTFGTLGPSTLFGNAATINAVPTALAVGADLTLAPSGTLSVAGIPATTLFGNPGTVTAPPSSIVVGSNLTLTTGGTLNATNGGGSVTSITCNNGLSGGIITTTGVCSITPIAAHSLFGNPTAGAAVPAAVAVGTGLTLAASGTLSSTGTATVTSITFNGGLTSSPNPVIGAGTASLAAIANGDVLANISGSSLAPVGVTGPAFVDAAFGATVGNVLQRGTAGWAGLSSATAGQIFESGGTGVADSWVSAIPAGTTANLLSATGTLGLSSAVTVTNGVTLTGGTLSANGVPAATTGNLLCATGTIGIAAACANITQMVSVPLASSANLVAAGTTYLEIGIPWTSETINSVSIITGGSGTPSFTTSFLINGATITSCGSINSTTSLTTTSCTAANTMGATDLLTMVVSNVSGTPELASVQLKYSHSVP